MIQIVRNCWRSFRIFFIRIRNAFQYAWRGWKTIDFDSSAALEDFIWKLGRLRKTIERDKRHVGWEKDVKHIRIVELSLRRVIDDEYYFPDMDKMTEKYGEIKFFPADYGENFVMRHEHETPENKEKIRKEARRCLEKARIRRQHDWEYALFLIHKYFWRWWN